MASRQFFTLVLACPVLLAALAAPALAQQPVENVPSPWLELARETRPGHKLAVLTTDGTWREGALVRFSEAGLSLDVGGNKVELSREKVWEIWNSKVRSRGSYKKGLLWGLAVGAGLGAVAYSSQGDCADPTSSCAQDGKITGGNVVALTVVSGGVGALIGRLAGGKTEEARRLYVAPAPGAAPTFSAASVRHPR